MRKGVTLIEWLVVAAIAVILGTMAICFVADGTDAFKPQPQVVVRSGDVTVYRVYDPLAGRYIHYTSKGEMIQR